MDQACLSRTRPWTVLSSLVQGTRLHPRGDHGEGFASGGFFEEPFTPHNLSSFLLGGQEAGNLSSLFFREAQFVRENPPNGVPSHPQLYGDPATGHSSVFFEQFLHILDGLVAGCHPRLALPCIAKRAHTNDLQTYRRLIKGSVQ